ncbi:hypothetical protein [Cutibacterium acnes]|uniref:hypothetical protein n=1 Tax=Cutibacterium acnes TaxID=1747 RepID=UPI000515DF1E|nr:hypothetical protein [Cutibacterium acnes]
MPPAYWLVVSGLLFQQSHQAASVLFDAEPATPRAMLPRMRNIIPVAAGSPVIEKAANAIMFKDFKMAAT